MEFTNNSGKRQKTNRRQGPIPWLHQGWNAGVFKRRSNSCCQRAQGADEKCAHAISRECAFVVTPDQAGEDEIADIIRACHAISNCTDKRTAIIYEVGASWVASCNPSRNAPPFRKDHYEINIRGFLNSRGDSGQKGTRPLLKRRLLHIRL